ncbi:helix-turn-helix domain-containing protein [Micromonospora mangrovi]|uniref:Helix-turn-helix domain-containing protein n=2 Tax=Micromonospora TaxID=1873 RepID=A0AAU7M308_9ACTN
MEQLSVRDIQARTGLGRNRLQGLLKGVPAPEWTRRPNAKDGSRAEAVALRAEGWSVTDIAERLGVSRSTAYQWVKHLPLDPASERVRKRRAEAAALRRIKVDERREQRLSAESEARRRAAVWAGCAGPREILLIGAALYWCEGTKSKPENRRYDLVFTNSDIRLVELFVRFVEANGRSRQELRYRVSIHENADAEAAGRWWAEQLGIGVETLQSPTLKRHNPRTTRLNTGDDYRGCLVVRVPRARALYLWIEGVMDGLSKATGVPE